MSHREIMVGNSEADFLAIDVTLGVRNLVPIPVTFRGVSNEANLSI